MGHTDSWDALIPTTASLGPLLCLVSKSFVCWCSDDSEFAALGIDMGYLVFLGAFSTLYVPGEGPALEMVREHIVEVIAVHMILECIFNGFLHKLINREGAKHMTWDMWVHHIGSIFGALFCKVVGPMLWVEAMRLGMTEITIALPVALKHARRAKRLNGSLGAMIGILMLLAFLWRAYWSWTVVFNFLTIVSQQKELNGLMKYHPLGALSLASVALCNCYWLHKIISSVAKQVGNSKRNKVV